MGCGNLNFTIISFHLLLFCLFIFNLRANSQRLSNPLEDGPCANANCGQGKCIASSTSILGFDCECNSGWTKFKLAIFTFPPCVVPNCTVDFQCGPPPPPPIPQFNLSNPCGLVWCGDGTCVVNGTGLTGYYCQCNDGSANFMNLTGLACFKQCYLDADCTGVGFGNHPPPPSSSGSPGNGGSNDVPNCSRTVHALSVIMLSVIFLTWI